MSEHKLGPTCSKTHSQNEDKDGSDNNANDTLDSADEEPPQIYCGIWMQLDVLIGRQTLINVWDKLPPRFPRMPGANAGRKKDGYNSKGSRSKALLANGR